jgi:hypothetical protein
MHSPFMYTGGQYFGPGTRCKKEAMLRQTKLKRSWAAPPRSHPSSGRKVCKPEESASLIVLLASGEASFVTGATSRWTVAS